MRKQAFLAELRKRLAGLPQEDIEERLSFYNEMIDDRMEEGLSEEAAVSAVGSVEEIVADTPAAKKNPTPKRRLKAWEIVLLVLGSPIWLSLLIAAVAVILSVYVVLWSAIVSLWAVFGSLIGCALGGVAGGVVFICAGYGLSGIAAIAAGLVCGGLAIFAFYGCKAATTGILLLTKKPVRWIKNSFTRKEKAQ